MMTPPHRRQVHLVRHGEVHNPDHVVYADLPGFGLSDLGRRQAAETAAHLDVRPVTCVVSSPLQRAIETAGFIAARHGIGVVVDPELTEWRLSMLWVGIGWEDLETRRPGELAAYLEHPENLPFSPEPLADLGNRIAAATRLHAAASSGDVVVVSHQDPIHAGMRTLTGIGLGDFAAGKPAHATVLTLDPAPTPWRMVARFDPEQGEVFPPVDD